MATQQQLFSLLGALEKLPAAHVPLDAARAKLLGVPTAPDAAFAGAVEALFLFIEQPRPDMSVIEALLGVIEHVTASPGALQRILTGRAPAAPAAPTRVQKSVPEVLLETPAGDWVTGDVIDRRGAAAYAHLIRGKNDPKERLPQGQRDPFYWKKSVQKGDLAEWRKKLLDLLATHGPSTYNALSVHATGLSAEITFQEMPDKALWSLVSDGLVEHTLKAPILFRLVQRRKGEATACSVPAPKKKKGST